MIKSKKYPTMITEQAKSASEKAHKLSEIANSRTPTQRDNDGRRTSAYHDEAADAHRIAARMLNAAGRKEGLEGYQEKSDNHLKLAQEHQTKADNYNKGVFKTEPHLPVAPPSGQQSTKPASPPKAPSVKPPTPMGKAEDTSNKVHVKEFIVPISKGGMLRWHSSCIKGDNSTKGQTIKGREPDAEYTREAASGLPGLCVGCGGELSKDPNGVPVPPEDLSTKKSEADIDNLKMAQEKKKFLNPLKHHYAHLLQAHKMGKSEQALKSANMCATYLRLLDLTSVPEELKNNKDVDLEKTEHPLDKEAKKLSKTLTMEASGGVPSSDTQGAAMMKHWDEDKDKNPYLTQAKKLYKEGFAGWYNNYTIKDRNKAQQAVELYRKGGNHNQANYLQSVLNNKNTKDLSMKKNEGCDPGTYEPLMKMRGYMTKLAKCGEMAIVKAEHDPKGIQNPNSSGQGYHPDHANHPYHDTIVSHGYEYSHSTPITDLSGRKYLQHSYKHKVLKDHVVGVSMKDDKPGWSVSKLGSGVRTIGNDNNKLNSFLKGHVSRANKKNSV